MEIYRFLFNLREKFTANELLVYSALLSTTVMKGYEDDVMGGKLSSEQLSERLAEVGVTNDNPYADFPKHHIEGLCTYTGMPRSSVYRAIRTLREKHILCDSRIYCPEKIFSGGFIKIPKDVPFGGWLRIFYGYMLSRQSMDDGPVKVQTSAISEKFNTTRGSVKQFIYQLVQAGCAVKTSEGKLRILKPEEILPSEETGSGRTQTASASV